ncbi:endonuclease III [Thermomicrobium sp. 4228-Ro]|uniref:endonuclease III domain-containing protein n=1 Tax=Thermomicrobium sp. 4228-Ro TaxID=2993937 RepID=UPI002248AF19|nr:endonuclease III [Thermomicrobium sp. 4228-Ro]MCX2727141.1 endonuclease III [Thermomicrobium sp. 4228-Ro]
MQREADSFDIDEAIRRLREVVRSLPPAALFQLAAEGFRTLFEVLVACIVSVRTRDEVTVPVARRLFARARTPEALAQLTEPELAALLRPATFAETKARNLLVIAGRLQHESDQKRLCDETFLLQLPGVGPKCAHLVLGIACGLPRIAVDVHVHRITNRWGYVRTRAPEQTLRELERKLPQQYWIEINRLLVPFGKHICTGVLPRCSQCVLADLCPRIGVARHR